MNRVKTMVLYHEDNDGYCSAAIFKKYVDVFNVADHSIKFVPIDYHKVDKFLEWFEAFLKNQENDLITLMILDFSFGENWARLLKLFPLESIVWIDHHKNAIENGYGTDICSAQGLRDVKHAGCMLTWNYFFPNLPAPWAVKFAEDYDIWKFAYEDDTKAFLYATQAEGKYISNPESEFWKVLLSEDGSVSRYSTLMSAMLRDGHSILKYIVAANEEKCRAKAYISYLGRGITRERGLKCVVINGGRGSAVFDSVTDDYEMMVVYWFDGEFFNYSFYSHKESGVDVSEIARAYGGNGHPNAAGCRAKEMLFPRHEDLKW